MHSKTILVAPLHWGLGHAARCIPIVQKLLDQKFKVIMASDGAALELMRLEFPDLPFIKLPSYNITYPTNGKLFKWKLMAKLPKIQSSISKENKIIADLVNEGKIDGIISDNRYGVRNKEVPSVFITHQLHILSGNTSFFSSFWQQNQLNKFDQCWVPDVKGNSNFSGILGHYKKSNNKVKYLGVLSRMKKIDLPLKYDILVILSGPEPQRSFLETKLIELLKPIDQKVLLIQGVLANQQLREQIGSINLLNFTTSSQLETFINESDIIISRPGYTTIMDLSVMEKKAYFIPTPGQYEQEYLAKRMKKLGIAPYCEQSQFTLNKLQDIKNYSGFSSLHSDVDFRSLFRLFERK